MPYRAGDDRERRIARLLQESRQLSSRLMPRYWRLLAVDDPGIERRLNELITRLESGEESQDALERALVATREQLAAAVRNAPEVQRRLTELPDRIPADALGPPWPLDETVSLSTGDYAALPASARETLVQEVAGWLGTIDPSAELDHRGGELRAAPLELAGAPMALGVTPLPLTGDVRMTLATAVRRALAPVRLARHTWLHTFTTAIRLQSDTRLGDATFDDHFLVEADEAAAKQLLDAPLRKELLGLAHFATPTLTLGDGLARLSFSYPFSPTLLERAARLLASVRACEVEVRLLRPEKS